MYGVCYYNNSCTYPFLQFVQMEFLDWQEEEVIMKVVLNIAMAVFGAQSELLVAMLTTLTPPSSVDSWGCPT